MSEIASKAAKILPQYCISIVNEERFPHGPYDTESEAVVAAVELNKTEYGGEYDSFLIGETKTSREIAFSNIPDLCDIFFEEMEEYFNDRYALEDGFAEFNELDKDGFKKYLRKLLDADRYEYNGIIPNCKRIAFENVADDGSYSE